MGSGLGQKCARSGRPAPTVFSAGSCPREKPRSGLSLASTKRDESTPAPQILLRQWLHDPHAPAVAAFAIAALFLGVAGWFIQRSLRYNEPGLRTPVALPFALVISAAGVFGADRLPAPFGLIVGASIYALAGLLFYYADHRRFVRNPVGKVAADRWQVVLAFAGFRWTRDKANRHFYFSGDAGSGKTCGMNGLMLVQAPRGTEAHFYRTAAGAEIELILTLPGGELWAVEIKRSSAPKLERGFHLACADLTPAKRFVIYPGNERFPLDAETEVLSLVDIGKLLQAIK